MFKAVQEAACCFCGWEDRKSRKGCSYVLGSLARTVSLQIIKKNLPGMKKN